MSRVKDIELMIVECCAGQGDECFVPKRNLPRHETSGLAYKIRANYEEL